MDHSFVTQTDQPLFSKILWNRPINKLSAGRLLLIGGHRGDFAAIQEIYQFAQACNVGQCTIVMPDSLRPILPLLDDFHFVPSSPSGSIGRGATADLIRLAEEADGLSLGADLSNNSETAVAIEQLLMNNTKPCCLYLDTLDVAGFSPKLITERSNCCLVVTMKELFKLAGKLNIALHIQAERGLLGRVELVQGVAENMQASLVVIGRELIVVSGSRTSVTPEISDRANTAIYAAMSVFWTQKPSFEHLTTASYLIRQLATKLPSKDSITTSHVVETLENIMSTI